MPKGKKCMLCSTCFKHLFCNGWAAFYFLVQLALGPVVIYALASSCFAKSLDQTGECANSKIQCKYMEEMEFGFLQVSALYLAALISWGLFLMLWHLQPALGSHWRGASRPVFQMERRLLSPHSICGILCRWWDFSWPACFPVTFVPVYSSCCWMQEAVAGIVPGDDTLCL